MGVSPRVLRAGLMAGGGSPGGARILILAGDIGAGHVSSARALAASLVGRAGLQAVELRTDLTVMGPVVGRFMRRGFDAHLAGIDRPENRLRRLRYEFAYRVFFQRALPRRAAHLALATLAGGGLRRTVASFAPDVVVTEFPVLSAALGQLRSMGRLPVPVCSAVSDPAGLWYWAHPGIDLHLVSWPEALTEVERIAGPGRAAAVRPVIDARLASPPSRGGARAALGLPAEGPVIVISGGGWGVGDLPGAAQVALRVVPEAHVICLAGHSREARRRLDDCHGRDPRVQVLGFTERMPELLAAADLIVHTTGGTTALEARAVGCRLINFGSSVAHVRAHARALAEWRLARWAPRLSDLGVAVSAALAEAPPPRLRMEELPEAADLILSLAGRKLARAPEGR